MKEKIRKLVCSTRFIIILGLIIVPILSFVLITVSKESPLYTSISRIAWITGHWFVTFLWAIIIMASITWITYRMTAIGPLDDKSKKIFAIYQMINIILVFIGCVIFPAKPDPTRAQFVHYIHDYLTIAAWVLYGIGLITYSILLRKKDKLLGFLGLGLMSFVVFSSLFFVKNVIDPSSYVGASAVSEVYIINSLFIYLVVMYVAEEYTNEMRSKKASLPNEFFEKHTEDCASEKQIPFFAENQNQA
ncbi:MAG: hypothetical protein E7612_11470 [Ruminococcaceae bacterium]|nr:hypothetical protein [Oscillospiraceae bacterium]